MLALKQNPKLQIAVRERTLPKRSVNILRWPLETRPQQPQTHPRLLPHSSQRARAASGRKSPRREVERGTKRCRFGGLHASPIVVDARALRDALAASGDDADDDALADALAA